MIVGPNGAGKSTAMKAIFGILSLNAGNVILEGSDISDLRPEESSQRHGICSTNTKCFYDSERGRKPRNGCIYQKG